MAKGQKRSGREPKKPKKKMTKTAAMPASVFDDGRQAAKKKPAGEPAARS